MKYRNRKKSQEKRQTEVETAKEEELKSLKEENNRKIKETFVKLIKLGCRKVKAGIYGKVKLEVNVGSNSC
jgi:LEA14-like dessication related protein